MDQDYVIDAFGARWYLDTKTLPAGARSRLQILWQRCRVPGSTATDAGVEPFVVASDEPYAVSSAITLASLGRRRGSAVLLHAAGFSRGERAIAVVGRSGAGKSTAALTLGRHFGYLSDETVAIELDGSVTGYPKPVSVITDHDSPWAKQEWSPDELGLEAATGPAFLAAVIVLERDPDVTVPELVPLPLADALLTIIGQSSSLPRLTRPLHRLAELASRSAGPYALRYSEIDTCVELIADLLDGPRPHLDHEPWSSTPGPAIAPDQETQAAAGMPPASAPAELTSGLVLDRGPWVDAVHGSGGTVVLVDHTPVLLGPVGEALWLAAAEGMSLHEAQGAVIRALGPHPEADDLVSAGVTSLIEARVLTVR